MRRDQKDAIRARYVGRMALLELLGRNDPRSREAQRQRKFSVALHEQTPLRMEAARRVPPFADSRKIRTCSAKIRLPQRSRDRRRSAKRSGTPLRLSAPNGATARGPRAGDRGTGRGLPRRRIRHKKRINRARPRGNFRAGKRERNLAKIARRQESETGSAFPLETFRRRPATEIRLPQVFGQRIYGERKNVRLLPRPIGNLKPTSRIKRQ